MKLKVYTAHDGRTNYAVAASSRKAAAAIFSGAGVSMTVGSLTNYGETFLFGELEDLHEVEATPGVVFRAPVMMREDDRWERHSRRSLREPTP